MYLFLLVKSEMAVLIRRLQSEVTTLRGGMDELRQKLADLDSDLEERAVNANATPKDSLNISKRSQVLRMYRRGEKPEAIAAALGMAQSEVDLLLKVQRIMLDSMQSPAPEEPQATPPVAAT